MISWNRILKRALLLTLVGAALMACKGRKKTETSKMAFKKVSTQDALVSSQSTWNFYSAKAKVELDGEGLPKTIDAVIKMQRDSVVWISVGLFGLEGARIFMHSDSITVLNKLGKSYSRISWKTAGEYVGTDLNLQKTQNLIMGNLLLPVDTFYRLNQDSSLYFIERIMEKSIYKVRLDSFDHHLKNSFFRGDKTGKNLSIQYSAYVQQDSILLPEGIDLKAKDGMKQFKGKIKLSNLNLAPFGTLPTRIPGSFRRN